jgi:dihydrofolate reductase
MIVSLIAALGKSYQLGKDNKLLWHIKDDLTNFKNLTIGHHVVFGLNTYRSLPRKLANRTPIVFSPTPLVDVITVRSVEEAMATAVQGGETELFICGGAQVYQLFLPKVTRLYLSWIDYDGPADTFFKVDTSGFHKILAKNYSNPTWRYEIWDKSPNAI